MELLIKHEQTLPTAPREIFEGESASDYERKWALTFDLYTLVSLEFMPAIRSKRRKSCAHHNDSKRQRAASPSQESDEELEKQVLRTALERTLNISTDPDSTKKQLLNFYKRNLHKLSPVPTAMCTSQLSQMTAPATMLPSSSAPL
ncbi:unnamed protein product, partial [Didymodactylos carnosus]